MKQPRIVITVTGGMVSAVACDINARVLIIDYDGTQEGIPFPDFQELDEVGEESVDVMIDAEKSDFYDKFALTDDASDEE